MGVKEVIAGRASRAGRNEVWDVKNMQVDVLQPVAVCGSTQEVSTVLDVAYFSLLVTLQKFDV